MNTTNYRKSYPQIKRPDFTENMIKIDEMIQNIIREFAKVTNIEWKCRAPLKKSKD